MIHDTGTITVEATGSTLDDLLDKVLRENHPVRIIRNGRAVADLRPIAEQKRVWPDTSDLKAVEINGDPAAPLDEEDWPSDLR